MAEKVRTWACYLLTDGKRVYIGKSKNPIVRTDQHNGIIAGGAKKTKKMDGMARIVCVVEPFYDETTALQFEWAWQKRWNRCRSLKRAHDKLFRLLSTPQWTKAAIATTEHPPLLIHWFSARVPTHNANAFVVGGGVTEYLNSNDESVLSSMYPDGYVA